MRFSKRKLFLTINGSVAIALLIYLSFWAFCPKITGNIEFPLLNSTTMTVSYQVGDKVFTTTLLRNGISFLDTKVVLHYNPWNPGQCRIYSFLGLVAEPVGWWGVLLFASVVLLLTNNSVFSKGTIFVFHKKRPWLVVEEFYPVKSWWQQRPSEKSKSNNSKKTIKRLE